MQNVFVFDLDGTLTPTREEIDGDFHRFFLSFCRKNTVYVVSGADIENVREQLGDSILDSLAGIFPCGGNEFWQKLQRVYANKLALSFHEIDILQTILTASKYPSRRGDHIKKRMGMITFSMIGGKATKEQRQHYIEWERINRERYYFVQKIRTLLPRLDATVSGDTSIDVFLRGNDKGQVYPFVAENGKQVIFFGDKGEEDENDYPLAMLVDHYYNVTDWRETMSILKEKYHVFSV